MAELFDIGHEVDLSEYTGTSTDSGDLSQGTPGLAGTVGRMECLIDDTLDIRGSLDISSPTTDFRCRFYIDPNTLTMGTGDAFMVMCARRTTPTTDNALRVQLNNDGSNYGIRIIYYDDANDYDLTSYYTITDAEHYIEVHIVRSSNGGSDGTAELWIDGASKEQLTGIDDYDSFPTINVVRLGAFDGIDATTSGTFYLDELKGNDDGGEIGPVSSDLSVSESDGLTIGEAGQSVASLGDIAVAMDEAAYQGTGVRVR